MLFYERLSVDTRDFLAFKLFTFLALRNVGTPVNSRMPAVFRVVQYVMCHTTDFI